MSFGGHMGNPNPLRQPYRCQTCGEPIPPYEFYCERHREVGEQDDKPLLIDRIMDRLLGRARRR
jgi:DNA-directed RNA polymerase subunit N (RpoN/RPB10)